MEFLFLIFLIVVASSLVFKKPQSPSKHKKSVKRTVDTITVRAEPAMMKKAAKGVDSIILMYLPELNKRDVVELKNYLISAVSSGRRCKSISKSLIKDYEIAINIASQLSGHAANYILSKYSQHRHERIGGTQYKWLHGHNGRNGCDHGHLHEKMFEYKNPPIVDAEGTRANPGELYPCTCLARAIID